MDYNEKISLITQSIKDVLSETSSNFSQDGEPETGYLHPGQERRLGVSQGKPEKWFHKEGWEQIDFPVADNIYGRGEEPDYETVKKVKGIPEDLDPVENLVDDEFNDDFLEKVNQNVKRKLLKLIGHKLEN